MGRVGGMFNVIDLYIGGRIVRGVVVVDSVYQFRMVQGLVY
jgi:hypothetical protein